MSFAWLKFLVFVSFAYENYAAILQDGGEMIPTTKFGTKSYYFSFNFKANFYQSNQVCEDFGMRLVTIPTKEVNDFLYQNINEANKDSLFWTSGTNLVDGINWVWISSAIPVVYTNWLIGQPDSPAEHCIELILQKGIDLRWNNLDCNVELNFVCESLDVNDNGEVTATNWAGVFADPSVSPNFPVFNYNENSYYIGNQVALSYMESTRFCKLIGMELVSIDSEEENYMIYKYIRDTVAGVTFWSGGSRLIDGVNWYWLPSGGKVVYTSWLKGQPDTKVEYCIQLQFLKDLGLFWNDLTCAVAQNFICKVPTKEIARCPIIDTSSTCHECCHQPSVLNVFVNNKSQFVY